MPSEKVLEVENLKASLKLGEGVFEAVKGISFDLYSGRTLALVGESGCGKSMTAYSLMRIASSGASLKPTGKALYKGKNLMTLSEREMRSLRGGKIAMIFQDPNNSLNPVMTIGEQLIEACQLHLNLDEEESFYRAAKVLTSVGIAKSEERMGDYPHQMSGGMKQRVMIAMALLPEPDILIADEPTTALDVSIQAQVIELFKKIQLERKMSILLITHDMGVVAELAHDVAVMYAGEVMESGTSEMIFDHPAHPYTIGLFDSLKREGARGHLATIRGSVPSLNHIPKGCPFHPRCPKAFEACKAGTVPHFNVAKDPAHLAKCWLMDDRYGR